MKKKIGILLTLLIVLTACNEIDEEEKEYEGLKQRFNHEAVKDIITDEETGCKYMLVNNTGTGVTSLLNEYGETYCFKDKQ